MRLNSVLYGRFADVPQRQNTEYFNLSTGGIYECRINQT